MDNGAANRQDITQKQTIENLNLIMNNIYFVTLQLSFSIYHLQLVPGMFYVLICITKSFSLMEYWFLNFLQADHFYYIFIVNVYILYIFHLFHSSSRFINSFTISLLLAFISCMRVFFSISPWIL